MNPGQVQVDVECDGCRRVETVRASSVATASEQLEAEGWLRNKARDQDLCPSCLVTRAGYAVSRVLL